MIMDRCRYYGTDPVITIRWPLFAAGGSGLRDVAVL